MAIRNICSENLTLLILESHCYRKNNIFSLMNLPCFVFLVSAGPSLNTFDAPKSDLRAKVT